MPGEHRNGYSERQRRQARLLISNYLNRGVPPRQARTLAWATIDLMSGGRPAVRRAAAGSGRRARASKLAPRA